MMKYGLLGCGLLFFLMFVSGCSSANSTVADAPESDSAVVSALSKNPAYLNHEDVEDDGIT